MAHLQSFANPAEGLLLVDRIADEHEQLRIVLGMAERCAANADRGHCQQVLRWALQFLEQHRRTEESVLIRCSYKGVHGVRRDHERLCIALEQALTALEADDATDISKMLRQVSVFLGDNVARDAQSLHRFFFTTLPCRLPAGTG